ncbi:hypothetical protein PG993_010205 [Apiospora rasikravindrae]|uniref:Uncharacterized protein n=1 Tax=Apiospora rasikravindrae TaxID=990691 RepID=A0ABR1SND0_9PEZI
MVNMDTGNGPLPTYFEHSWAILSSIGLINVCFGFMVIGIVGFPPIATVPIIVSIASALANGLCYFAYYTEYPKTNTIVASAFADVFWLIQEAGLSFYSYSILSKMLYNRTKMAFMLAFWALMLGIVTLRTMILTQRVRYLMGDSSATELQTLINRLHVGYFISIAIVECISSALLLLKFRSARRISVRAALQSGTGVLFSYLMRSTEVRLALLAVIGVTRAVTYSFQATAQSASSVAGQLDRFAYTLECTFPTMLLIDIIASRLVYDAHNPSYHRDNRSAPRTGHFTQTTIDEFKLYPLSNIERRIEVTGNPHQKSGSEENIINQASPSYHHHHHQGVSSGDMLYMDGQTRSGDAKSNLQSNGINKTVEFNVMRNYEN